MKLDYLKKLHQENLICIRDSFACWQDAVKASIAPMVQKGWVTEAYGDEIIRHVGEYGLYIFLCPHVCMPHCKAFSEVRRSGLCLMKVNTPVYPDPDDASLYAELFFAIAGTDANQHLECIQELMELLDDEETMDALLRVTDMSELDALLNS